MNEFAIKAVEGQVTLRPRNERIVPLLDDPLVGHSQATVLRTIQDLGSDASVVNVLQTLSLAGGVWIDHSQIYSIIRKLAKRSPPLIKVKHVRPRQGKRPAMKNLGAYDLGGRRLLGTSPRTTKQSRRI